MAITVAGFEGASNQVNQAQWARLLSRPSGGVREHVEGSGLVVTPTANAREVSVAAGYGYGGGVEFYNDAPVVLTAAANTSGAVRYDMVVAAINWSVPSVTITIRQNVSSVTALNRSPGSLQDVPLAMLTVNNGQTVFPAAQVMDIRPLGHGSLTIPPNSPDWGNGTQQPKAYVDGRVVSLRGQILRTGLTVNLSSYLTLGTLPSRIAPPGALPEGRYPVMMWSQSVGDAVNERFFAPVYLWTTDNLTIEMRLYDPGNHQPRLISGESFVDLSGITYVLEA